MTYAELEAAERAARMVEANVFDDTTETPILRQMGNGFAAIVVLAVAALAIAGLLLWRMH